MFKRVSVLFLACVIMLSFFLFASRPIFADYSDSLELYLNSTSSTAQIVNVKYTQTTFFRGVCGESFKADVDTFNLQEFLKKNDAQVIFIEEIEQGVSYYAFSPKIKYRTKLFDQTVNLHIFVGKQITVGTPLIFGSF